MTGPKDVGAAPGHRPSSPGEAAIQVSLGCRIIARFGHEDLTLGHVSVRGPEGNSAYIKRKGIALREVTPADVIRVELSDGDVRSGPDVHLETVMHTKTYLARADVGAVIHTHPLLGTALGATAADLSFLSHDAALFYRGVAVFDDTTGLITSAVDGKAVARALGDRRAVLLRNHGVLVVGEDIRWAVLAAVTLERAVQMQAVAHSLGEPVPMPTGAARELFPIKYQDGFVDEYWSAWCRMTDDITWAHQ